MRTFIPKHADIDQRWLVIDASDQVLGRLASEVARVLRGKNKPSFTPHLDTGDYVIVVNADKIRLTGTKADQKVYYRSSGRPGGLKQETARERLEKYPGRVLQAAVKGMLPKNRLGRRLFKKLKVYAGPEHPHEAQKPEPYTVPHAKHTSS
jgi:large subunit ribosomal protein L13